jgi:dihydroorotate dehydrogenase electron transfer subunit
VKQFEAEILGNRSIAEAWRELTLSWDEEAGSPLPGQFLTLRVSAFSDPLLRRPLAFSGYRRAFSGHGRAVPGGAAAGRGASVSAVYQVRGGATRLLSELSPGTRINAIGPLGTSFPRPAPGERVILAGGGIGLGPLLFLHDSLGESLLVLGFRSASLLPSFRFPPGTVICTDDGSSGFRGTPADWISRNAPAARARLYGCGPGPMLAALAALAAARGWDASLAAEQWMACGVGACMGCALPKADGSGYLRACTEGPVFEASQIDWSFR